MDYYAPLFFVEIAMIEPEDFCKKVNLCEDAGFISPQIYGDSCSVCHEAVVEVLLKLKDPDTQVIYYSFCCISSLMIVCTLDFLFQSC